MKVAAQHKDKRIDKFLQSQLKDLSRTKIQRLIYEGFVIINDFTIQEASKKIKFDDFIEVEIPPPKKTIAINSGVKPKTLIKPGALENPIVLSNCPWSACVDGSEKSFTPIK